MLVNVTLFVFVLVLCSMCCSLRVCRVCVRTPQISRLRRLSSTLDAGVPLVMEYKLLSNMIVAQGTEPAESVRVIYTYI